MFSARFKFLCSLSLVALPACGSQSVSADASQRFDVREASVESRDVALTEAGFDAPTAVDVTLADVGAGRDRQPPGDGAARCTEPAEDYATAVREAQACVTDDDCQMSVCETLCCTCRVRVNPATSAYALIATASERWESRGCAATVECPSSHCAVDTDAVCSTEGRCVTLRGTSGDGGTVLRDGGDDIPAVFLGDS